MNSKINDKIDEVEKYLKELDAITPYNFDEYLEIKTRAACERYFEKIVEAIADLAFLVIRENKFKTPEEDKEAFESLRNEKVITSELCDKLKNAKGMKNILLMNMEILTTM